MSQLQTPTDSDENPSQDVKTGGKVKWCSDAIHQLLKLRFERAHLFANPPGKKILLWNDISEELKKNNYNVSGKLCFAKFRNLTASYRRRKELGDSYCHWEFMTVMDTFFNDHPSSFVLESDNTLDQTYVSSTPGEEPHSIYIVQNLDEEEMEQDGEEHVMEEYEETTVEHQEEEEEEEEGADEGFHWSPIAVNLLLNLRFQRNQAFSLPHSQIKKSELWNEISAEMRKNNFNVQSHVCDLKFRSLLRHYKVKKDKRDQGIATNSWIHFDLMDAYLGNNDSKSISFDQLNQSKTKSSASSALYNLINDTVEDEYQGSSSSLKEGKDGFQWTPDAIKLFLKIRFDRQGQFLDPMSKKFKLWEDIGKEMQKHGYNISGFGCDNKFRNLLTTYRTVKRKIGSGEQFVRWRYYETFDAHYKNEPFPNKGIPVTPGKSVSLNHVGDSISDLEDEDDGDHDEDEGHYQRKKPKMTINRYLQHKMKVEEKKRKDFLALEERKLKLEYKKLEIEQKKIEVFKSLVAALKQGKK